MIGRMNIFAAFIWGGGGGGGEGGCFLGGGKKWGGVGGLLGTMVMLFVRAENMDCIILH